MPKMWVKNRRMIFLIFHNQFLNIITWSNIRPCRQFYGGNHLSIHPVPSLNMFRSTLSPDSLIACLNTLKYSPCRQIQTFATMDGDMPPFSWLVLGFSNWLFISQIKTTVKQFRWWQTWQFMNWTALCMPYALLFLTSGMQLYFFCYFWAWTKMNLAQHIHATLIWLPA